MRRSFSQVISPSRRTEAPADAPVPSPQTQPQRRMNDDEIYAKALEIARKKFAADSMEEPREIPEAQSAQKPDLYQEAPVPTQQPASDAAQRGPPRSRVKSFFSKVAQFSQENYGYQDKKNEPVANASTQASRPAGTGSSAQAEPQTSTLYSMDSNVSRRSMRGSASGPLQSSAVSSEPVRIATATPPETEETVPAPQVMEATTANSSPAATGPVPTKQVKVGFFQRLFKRSR